MVRGEIADLVSIKIMKSGGIARAREIASIAEAAGITAYGGTMFEGGLAIAAGLHMVAATPNISLGAEFYTSTWVMGAEILKTPIVIEKGRPGCRPVPASVSRSTKTMCGASASRISSE